MRQQLLAAALGCAALLSTTGCSRPEPRAADASSPMAVTIHGATTSDVADGFEVGGVVRARIVAAVTSRIMAEVRSVAVVPGDRVRAGQTLALLDARELHANRARAVSSEAAVRQAAEAVDADRQAALALLQLARVTHQRFSDLRSKNSATQSELDESVAALRTAEARVRAVEARVAATRAEIDAAAAGVAASAAAASYATLSAPFDGLVTEKSIDVGSMAVPGQTAFTIEDTRGFRLEARLDESRAALVRSGQPAAVVLSAGGTPGNDATGDVIAAGIVSEVSRALSADSHDFLVKIDLPAASQLRSGMYGKARFQGTAHRAIVVQAAAVLRRGQLTFVYVVERDNRAHLRLVNAAEPVDGRVEIRSGLLEGERVVSAPPPTLADGSPVSAGVR